ncbi:hypothetical protein MMC31_000848 [Peltigera leucophlebia]|nr:hypothetical protein [Peltigera leucophlebia]
MEPRNSANPSPQLPKTAYSVSQVTTKKKRSQGKIRLNHIPQTLASTHPLNANFDSAHLTIGAGVAIFHVATARVVLCYHPVLKHWFLPKGRRDVNEETARGAEREGFEEVAPRPHQIPYPCNIPADDRPCHKIFKSGYRNRLLPIPIRHRQPDPQSSSSSSTKPHFVTEPVWTQLAPVSDFSQYHLFWYITETVPPEIEASMPPPIQGNSYQQPAAYPKEMTLSQRIALEPEGYEPPRHENSGVDTDEALYEPTLLPVESAIEKLRESSVSADVVRKGWATIYLRREIEDNDRLK